MPSTSDPAVSWLEFADAALLALVSSHATARSADPATESTVTNAPDVDAARERFLASLDDVTQGFGALAHNAGLSAVECELVAFVVACELDARRQRLLGVVQDDPARTRPTLQTAGWLLGGLDRCAAAVGPSSRIRRAALLELQTDGPWAQQTLVVPAALVWAFLGDASPDPDLPEGTRSVERDPDVVDRSAAPDERALVITYGPDRVRRRLTAMHELGGERFLVVPQPAREQQWAAVVREATLTGRAVIVELEDGLDATGRRWVELADHLPWALTAARELPIAELPGRSFTEVDAPPTELTDDEWAMSFGLDSPHIHRLTPQQAERVSRVFEARGGDIDASVRRLLAGPLESLAQRIRPRHTWDDLVLSPNRLRQLQGIVQRYRSASQVYDRWGFSAIPSRGLVALFSGVSGAGKTLAAEILAGELGLDMFKLDLSSIVSKYIGETEKNLDQLFDAAGMGNVVLFFDEADALFGKRSEVKDARDRYANIEVSYLLQRVEAFDGVVVLATNFEKSIDEAFLRRIQSRIDFTLPEEPQRLDIWRRHLPAAALGDDVDLAFLAKQFDFSGGQIRNAAVHAGFVAAGENVSISMRHLVGGVAQELRKGGRLLRPETFGAWFDDVAD